MAMGGVPYYLENVQVNRSVAQNIDRMFFTPGAMLNLEYGDLYRSLFNRAERHIAVVEALAQKSKGLNRWSMTRWIWGRCFCEFILKSLCQVFAKNDFKSVFNFAKGRNWKRNAFFALSAAQVNSQKFGITSVDVLLNLFCAIRIL